jgi:hypothetical protein
MKKCIYLLLIVYCLLCIIPQVRADYVLPYPSYMPGNKLYRISRILDQLKGYWYFGNIAKAKYHQGLGDKYLVEAKTLFEYKQYFLAQDALKRSDEEVGDISQYVSKAQEIGIDINELNKSISAEMRVHVSVLQAMKDQLPEEFIWRPEKAQAVNLPIASMLEHSTAIREKIFSEATSSAQ